MSSMKDSLGPTEDFLCSLIELAAPDYELWRPYFEFDIIRLSEDLTGDLGLQDQRASLRLKDIAMRFLDSSVPLWVRETIIHRLLRVKKDGVAMMFLSNVIHIANDNPSSCGVALRDMCRESLLVEAVFKGAL